MPAPLDFSTRAGVPRVYMKSVNGSLWQLQEGWDCASVELGTRDRQHYATIKFNRDPVIRGDDPDPVIGQDSLWCVTFQPDGPRNPVMIFEGTPKLIERMVSGAVGASVDTGAITLQTSAILWADAEASQIYGRYMASIRAADVDANSTIAHDGSLPTVFNAGGRPNRSRHTAKNTSINDDDGTVTEVFAADAQDLDVADVHYFTDDDGRDVDAVFAADPQRRGNHTYPARYWTYAQALAYVLHFHAGAKADGSTTDAVTRNGVRLWFGYPPGTEPDTRGLPRDTDTDTLWGALIGDDRSAPRYKILQSSEDPNVVPPPGDPESPFDAPDDEGAFQSADIGPTKLLNARCHDLSIEGMNVIEALGAILHAAGLGWWIDPIIPYEVADPDNPTAPDTNNEQVFRVWTPGGQTASNPTGIGQQFHCMLRPYRSDLTGDAPVQIFAQNNVESLDATFDCGSLINAPLILKAPTIYEVTCMLRPGWQIFRSQENGFIDNVSPNTTFEDPPTDPDNPNLRTELKDAVAVINRALLIPTENSERFFPEPLPAFMRRVKTLWSVMHAKGILGPQFGDVLRKWIIPTDRSYPNAIFARDYATFRDSMPWEFGTYLPVNFAEEFAEDDQGTTVPSFILNPIPGAHQWPTRRRTMLPCITSDNNKQSLGVVVEVSLDGGRLDDTGERPDGRPHQWFQVTGFRVLDDECGIYFTFDNPFDLKNPTVLPGANRYQYDNLALAYIHNQARVRATFCIEASSTFDLNASRPDMLEGPDMLPNPATHARTRIVIRRGRYKKTVNLGRFHNQTVNQVALMNNMNDARVAAGQSVPAALDDDLTGQRDPLAKWFYERRLDHSAAARGELLRQQAMSGDWQVSGKFTIPWVDTDCRPGMVVEQLEEQGAGVKRLIDLRSLAGAGVNIGPQIAGVIYSFSSGGMRTSAVLCDWRAIQELGVPP